MMSTFVSVCVLFHFCFSVFYDVHFCFCVCSMMSTFVSVCVL